jgi:hypothetical protein
MFLATLSTVISSIALIGVAIGLYFQSRQLRSAQVDSTAASQRELMNFALSHLEIYGRLVGVKDLDELGEQIVLNWQFDHLRTSYMNRTVSDERVHSAALVILSTDMARRWWATAGQAYAEAATSRREKKFFAIFDAEFQRRKLGSEHADTQTRASDDPTGPPLGSS